ncbi:MAG: tetratricopeptide repeat protein [Sedimentisphaerales bacterium]|nr:tetratricopeptide repeat protein [Sedimentisphaerales bacterium]
MADIQNKTEHGLAEIESNAGSRKLTQSEKCLLAILITAVCLAVVIVQWPALSTKALSFDDFRYFEENPLVRNPSWESARRFFTEILEPSTVGGYYQPLTMTSLMIDYALSTPGEELRSFHRTSLALHTANTALIILFLYMLFGRVWIAAAVGLLFGVHPLTVETIAWVGERKTLLAAFFTFLSLVLYVTFLQKGGRKFFVWSLLTYALALLSKPTSTPLPVMMLLMDYWPLKRLKLASILEKAPFFIVGGISSVITYISQDRTASILTPDTYGVMRVPLVICHNIVFYLWKMVWPVRLTSHYPFPVPLDLSQPMILIGVIVTVALMAILLLSLRWTRAALTGWLIFFIMVLPTMQALQFSDVIASDKFVYLPSIGILMILAAFLGWIAGSKQRVSAPVICYGLIPIVVLVLAGGEAFAARQYLSSWKDSVSLWSHMVEVIPAAVSPRNNLGVAFAEAGNLEEAEKQFKTVLEIDPNDADGNYNMGNIMARRGNPAEAKGYYEKSFIRRPDEGNTYHAIGVLLVQEGKFEEAVELYRSALAQKKMGQSFLLYEGLGSIFIQMGRIDDAIAELEIAVRQYASSSAYGNLGLAMTSKGQLDKAEEYYKKAIRLNTNNAEAYYNLGNLYLSKQWLKEAAVQYQSAIKAKPKYVKAHANLAVAFATIGRLDEAIVNFRRVTELDPNNPDGFFNLAGALTDKGLIDEAVENLKKAVELAPMDIVARLDLAKLFMQKGQIKQASTELEQVLKIDPNNPAAQAGLTMIKQAKDRDVNTQPFNP